MSSELLDLGVVLFEFMNVLVAFSALVLAVHWKKTEFLAGLIFLLFYTILDAIELSLSVLMGQQIINASQFGFILLALVAFILGMRPDGPITRPA